MGRLRESERQRVRMEVMEIFREVRIFTAGQQMFAERLSERVSYQGEPRQIFLAHTDTRVQFRSALLILISFLRDVMLKQSGVTGLKKKRGTEPKTESQEPLIELVTAGELMMSHRRVMLPKNTQW